MKATVLIVMIANSFRVPICLFSVLITKVSVNNIEILGAKVYLLLEAKYIRFKIGQFNGNFGMAQMFDCINWTRAPIKCPVQVSQDYFCYMQFYYLNIQTLCDYVDIISWRLSAGVLAAIMMQKFHIFFAKLSWKFSTSTPAAFNFNFGKILAYFFHSFNCRFITLIYLFFWFWCFW